MILLEKQILEAEFTILCHQDFDFNIDLPFSFLSEAKKLILHKFVFFENPN